MRLVINPITYKSLTFTFTIALVLFIAFGNCSPAEQQPSHGPITANEEIANGTLESGIHARSFFFPRPELAAPHVCRKWFMTLFDQWIVQVPPEWWVDRYHNNADEACYYFRTSLVHRFALGFELVTWDECWRMEKNYPSGDIGWLHMRFKTPIFARTKYAKAAIKGVADYRSFDKYKTPIECLGPA